jgi:hypothetical protein
MGHLAKTYQHIADILSFENSNSQLEATLSHSTFDWDAIVVVGSRHVVLPAIYCRLKAKQLLHTLPDDLETYLEELTSINRNRNKSILKQVHAISQLLSAHSIDHVFLKGAALLALGCYEDNAERMVGDIDILISKSQLHLAFDLLKANGYSKTFGYAYETIGFRHLDRLIAPEELAAIELHSDLLIPKYRHLIAIDLVLESKRYVNTVALPDAYMMSKHSILAWQLNDLGHYYNAIHFKTFYDSLVLHVPSNEALLLDLSKFNFGRSYLELAKHYFKAFHSYPSHKDSKSHLYFHQKYTNNWCYSAVLRPLKRGYIYCLTRLKLVVYNKFYRRHLLKKIFFIQK